MRNSTMTALALALTLSMTVTACSGTALFALATRLVCMGRSYSLAGMTV